MSQAVVWAKAQDVGNPVAKAVLVCLASWADADDEAWASVPTMAMELERSERTIQRGIAWLLGKRDNETDAALAPKFIFDTGRKRLTREGRFIPIYGFHLEQGPANTKARWQIEREARCGQVAVDGARGVTPVSPQKNYGCQTEQPTGDNGDIRGVTPVSPKERTKTLNEPEERAGGREAFADGVGEEDDGGAVVAGFERVWAAWSVRIKDGVAKPDDRAVWIAVCEAADGLGCDLAGLERAALNYLANSPAVKRGNGKSLKKWLAEEGWRQWTPSEPERPATARPMFAVSAVDGAPLEFRLKVRAEVLASCGWDDAGRALLVTTNFYADRLRRDLRQALAECDIRIIVRKAA